MKTIYPIQTIDLRFPVDNDKKIHLFEDFSGASYNARMFLTLFGHRETKMISDWKKISEVDFFSTDNTNI